MFNDQNRSPSDEEDSFRENSVKSAMQNAYDLGIEAEVTIKRRIENEETSFQRGQILDVDFVLSRYKEKIKNQNSNKNLKLIILTH